MATSSGALAHSSQGGYVPRILARILFLAAAVCVTTVTVPAQQKFTSSTSLLTLDVSVLDQDGNPITGLTADDFVVTLNKETQPVRTIVFLATQSHSATETVRVASPGSQPSPTPAAERSVLTIAERKDVGSVPAVALQGGESETRASEATRSV